MIFDIPTSATLGIVSPPSGMGQPILTQTGAYTCHYRRSATIASIQAVVADYYAIDPMEMKSARRGRDVARPRQVAMYLCRELTPKSLPDIGRRFGGRDHSTVIHAIKKIEELIHTDAEMRCDVGELRRAMGA